METAKKIYQATCHLIDCSGHQQLQRPQGERGISVKGYLKEFCTIRVCSSRQTGHTTAIFDLITKYFLHKKTYVFLPNQSLANIFKQRIKSYFKEIYEKESRIENFAVPTKIGSINNSLLGLSVPQDLEAIIVDCSSFLSKKKQEALYDAIANGLKDGINKPIFMIFMQ